MHEMSIKCSITHLISIFRSFLYVDVLYICLIFRDHECCIKSG